MAIRRAKIILVVESDEDLGDALRGTFVQLHELYTRALCSPFHDPGSRITSSDFAAAVAAALSVR